MLNPFEKYLFKVKIKIRNSATEIYYVVGFVNSEQVFVQMKFSVW